VKEGGGGRGVLVGYLRSAWGPIVRLQLESKIQNVAHQQERAHSALQTNQWRLLRTMAPSTAAARHVRVTREKTTRCR
jgi:hypothetical protein